LHSIVQMKELSPENRDIGGRMLLTSHVGLLTTSRATYDAKCHTINFAHVTTRVDVHDLVHVCHFVFWIKKHTLLHASKGMQVFNAILSVLPFAFVRGFMLRSISICLVHDAEYSALVWLEVLIKFFCGNIKEGRIQLKGDEITAVTYYNENRHWFEINALTVSHWQNSVKSWVDRLH